MQVKCARTGLKFEATSKRQKNHPKISEILGVAHRDGWYGAACEALEVGRETEVDTIEGFLALLKWAEKAQEGQRARENIEREQARQAQDERRKRENALLEKHKYVWEQGYSDHDAYEDAKPDTWELWSPDNRVVSVSQALDEIERGVQVVLAEQKARDEQAVALRMAEEMKAQATQAEAEKFSQKWREVQKWTEVQSFADRAGTTGTVEIADYWWGYYNNYRDVIYSLTVNEVECFITKRDGGSDDSDHYRYFCQDIEKAGLEPITKRSETDQFLADFFG